MIRRSFLLAASGLFVPERAYSFLWGNPLAQSDAIYLSGWHRPIASGMMYIRLAPQQHELTLEQVGKSKLFLIKPGQVAHVAVNALGKFVSARLVLESV